MERFKDSDFVRLLLENGADAEVDNRGYSLGALSSRYWAPRQERGTLRVKQGWRMGDSWGAAVYSQLISYLKSRPSCYGYDRGLGKPRCCAQNSIVI